MYELSKLLQSKNEESSNLLGDDKDVGEKIWQFMNGQKDIDVDRDDSKKSNLIGGEGDMGEKIWQFMNAQKDVDVNKEESKETGWHRSHHGGRRGHRFGRWLRSSSWFERDSQ